MHQIKPIVIIGEAWGQQEAKTGTPFCGPSGIELLRMLDEASVITLTSADTDYITRYYRGSQDPTLIDAIWRLHPEIYRTNVFAFHPPGNDIETVCGTKSDGLPGYPTFIKGKYVSTQYAPELLRLGREIEEVAPNLIICLGNTPTWALLGRTGVSKIRGTTHYSTLTASGYKILPTYHPAAILRQWENRPIALVDLIKAKHEATFPEVRRPQRQIWIEPTISDIEDFYANHIRGCRLLSVDIETSGNRVTCIGFAPTIDLALVVPFDDGRRKDRSYWRTVEDEQAAWAVVRRILVDRDVPKLLQNGMYDIAFLLRSVGIGVRNAAEDTMLLSHALQPEMLKGLAFLGSLYTNEGPWKSERKGETTIKRDA